jgi:hypothetical protein
VTSRVIRQIHLYLALFLGPWVLLYGISTIVMNHRALFRGEEAPPPPWEIVSDGTYDGEFPPQAGRQQMAHQILSGLQIDGNHQATLREGKLVVTRHDAVRPMRITYTPEDRRLVVERQAWEGAAFLERMHRRRGFRSPYVLDDMWAFSVDLFIAAVLFWTLSGLWLWWEMRPTRRLGGFLMIGGVLLFAFFVMVL